MKPWMIVAFYTTDSLYMSQAENLRKSLEKLNLKYYIKPIEPLKSWKDATLYTADLIMECLDMFDENIVYVDADAVIQQYPVLFDTIEEDIAVHYRKGKEMLGGTIYLKNSDKVKHLVSEWKKRANESTHPWAIQIVLEEILREGTCSVYRLPAPYTLIFDSMKDQGPPVIEHFQASRKFKGKRG